MLPQWHKLYDEYYLFDYNLCGIVKVYMNKNENFELKKACSAI